MIDPRTEALTGLGKRLGTIGRRMTPGALGGRTELASPPVAVPGMVPAVQGPEASGGKEYATFVVAASNSTDHGKAAADYVCDGAGDQVEINAAFVAVGSAGVVLLEGDYYTTDGIIVDGVLRGQSRAATRIHRGDGGLTGGVGQCIVAGDRSIVASLAIYDESTTGVMTGVTPLDEVRLDDLYIQDFYRGVWFDGTYLDIRVTGCHVRGSGNFGLQLEKAVNAQVIGNTVESCTIGIGVEEDDNLISGNVVRDCSSIGIRVTSAARNIVSDNAVSFSGDHGISLAGADDNLIHDNYCYRNGDSSSDNINIDSTSDRNSVQGNVCRKGAASTRYGIRVEGTDNLVTNNDLLTGGATGNFSDTGTGTVTAAGNRV